MATLVQTDLNI